MIVINLIGSFNNLLKTIFHNVITQIIFVGNTHRNVKVFETKTNEGPGPIRNVFFLFVSPTFRDI